MLRVPMHSNLTCVHLVCMLYHDGQRANCQCHAGMLTRQRREPHASVTDTVCMDEMTMIQYTSLT